MWPSYRGWGSSSDSSQESGSGRLKLDARKVNDSLYEFDKPSRTPKMQILFFHGLAFEDSSETHLCTWESGDRSCIWPEKWLGRDFPGAQNLYVAYDGIMRRSPDSGGGLDIYNIGENLVSDLLQANVGQILNCPVIMVGHCFGGNVIKQVCLQAQKESIRETRSKIFLENVKGIFYYDTPQHGSDIFEKFGNKKHPLWSYFRVLSEKMGHLNNDFNILSNSHSWKIHALGAGLPVQSGQFKGLVVVTEASARVGHFTLRGADHFTICKPNDKTSSSYLELKKLLDYTASSIQLLLLGFDLNSQLCDKVGAMLSAAECGEVPAVQLLLQNGSSAQAKDSSGVTPLHRAAEHNRVSVVKLLLNNGADKEAMLDGDHHSMEDRSRATPLHLATMNGHTDAMTELLNARANIEARNQYKRTPLHLAARFGRDDAVRLLIDRGAELEARRDTNETPLHFAVEEGRHGVVNILIDSRADKDAWGDRGTPLEFAKAVGRSDIAALLLSRGAGFNSDLSDIGNGYEQLLSLGFDLNSQLCDKVGAMLSAAARGAVSAVQLLLQNGSSAQTKDSSGVTPLHRAAEHNRVSVVKLLLNNGADKEAMLDGDHHSMEDRSRATPLHLATMNGHTDAMTELLNARANIEARNQYKRTPLHLAARFGRDDAVRLLIDRGAEREARRDTNETPLHFAVEEGRHGVVNMLIDAKANKFASGNRGTPLEFARDIGRSDTAAVLLSRGA